MGSRIAFDDAFGTRFCLSVDTEEEFEWGGPFSRTAHQVTAVPALAEGQRFFSAAAVRPIYFADTPVVASDAGAEILGGLVADGSADVGVHLHPWVTPPFDEEVSRRNSYAGNLPETVERAKIRHLGAAIADRIGTRPIAYRAGRYGIGPNSYRILAEEGYRCDSSVRNLFDYRLDGGPDFRRAGHHASFEGPGGAIVELPLTATFIGQASSFGRRVFDRMGHAGLVQGILARTGMIERIPLTPEGTPAASACAAIDVAIDIGIRVLTLSFHSPSLVPGNTPYVRNAADLARFYRWFDTVFDHCARRGVLPASLGDILDAAERARISEAADV